MAKLFLLLASMLISGCALAPPSAPLTAISIPPAATPSACLQNCQPLPELGNDINAWLAELIRVTGGCVKLHADCVSQIRQ